MEIRGDNPADADAYAEAIRAAGGHGYISVDRIAADSAAVDVEQIVREEMARLGDPLPVPVARLGASGVGDKARRRLHDKGISEFDAAA